MPPVANIKSHFIISADVSRPFCKYAIIAFNIIYLVAGFTSLVLGLWLSYHDNNSDVSDLTSDNDKEAIELKVFNKAVYFLVTLGSIMAAVGIFGEYAACIEGKIALRVFTVLLFLLAAAKITTGALAYIYRDEAGKMLGDLYVDVYKLYVKNEEGAMAVTLGFFHSMLHCCGCSEDPLTELVRKTCPKVDTRGQDYTDDCPKEMEIFFNNKAAVVLGLFVGTAAFLIGEMICSGWFSSKVHQDS
ncbi:tetraspanin-2-like [Cyprinodon tularosa]|uniref:tetraspanin-2-like n=1 Tax=Cyprinodon tularosa TaxID=77115 RepID=UPI0018E25C6D|nr:tetraspanin-2-like [Cyprinodon tularosa]